MNQLSQVNFLPWVGVNYHKSRKKLLILGESHYGISNDLHSATTKYTQQYVSGGRNHKRFWKNITKICLDRNDPTDDQIKRFWESVIFYNYIQRSLEKDERPKKNDWKNSAGAFIEIINQFNPKYILMCGRELWKNTPMAKDECEGKDDDYWIYNLNNGRKSISTFIYHPSRYSQGLGYYDSREIFKNLINYL